MSENLDVNGNSVPLEYKIDNLKKDLPDERDHIFLASSYDLPLKVDMRQYSNLVENQLNTGSCVANATTSALEILLEKQGKFFELSRLFLYYNLREPYYNLKNKDIGSYTRDGFKFANTLGVCSEKTWAFDTSKINTKPSNESYTEGLNHKVQKYERILDNNVPMTKAALAKGYPVLIGMVLYRTFYSMPNKLENQDYTGKKSLTDSIGGHAMNIVGYDDDLNGFIVENSWSSNWGENGYFLLDYDVFKDDTQDVWVCTAFNGFEPTPEWEDSSPEIVLKEERQEVTNYKEDGREFNFNIGRVNGISPFTYDWEMYQGSGLIEVDELDESSVKFTMFGNLSKSILTCVVQGSGPLRKKATAFVTFNYVDELRNKPEPIVPEPIVKDDPIPKKPLYKQPKVVIGALVVIASISFAILKLI